MLWRTLIRDQQRTFEVKVKQVTNSYSQKEEEEEQGEPGTLSQFNPVATHLYQNLRIT
jgi:hypothetical protein